MKKKALISGVLLALAISIFTTSLIFPNFSNLLFTDINTTSQFNVYLTIKIIITLASQTFILGIIFYNIAKKIF